MLPKSVLRASLAVVWLILLAGCRSSLPWSKASERPEANLSFVIEQNLLRLTTAEINGRKGRFYLATAAPRTLFDPAFAASMGSQKASLTLTERRSLALEPVALDLKGIADAFIGAETWALRAVTIDYSKRLVTWQQQGIEAHYMTIFRFTAEPAVTLRVDGREVTAIVDTALPDTMILPRGRSAAGRTQARVELAGLTIPSVDIELADVSRARIGNRLLQHFLVTVDYGKQQVGLWKDPRIAGE